jgi:hypothetical protein
MIAARKKPTVLYGTSGEARSGMKPMEMTMALRVIARAGSENMISIVCFQSRVSP